MTEAKKLKKKIRERTQRTGESYATARTHVIAKAERARRRKTSETAGVARAAKATGAVSEQRCIEKTGHGYDHWFEVLDRFGALRRGHTAAARHLREEHDVSAWYSQAITVAYERAKGARVLGQTTAGTFQFSVSRTLPKAFAQTRQLLTHARRRSAWLDADSHATAAQLAAALTTRRPRSGEGFVELRYRPDDTTGGVIVLRVEVKDDGRSAVLVRHAELSSRDDIEPLRSRWKDLLDAFRTAAREAD